MDSMDKKGEDKRRKGLLERGEELFSKGQTEKAEQSFSELLEQDPTDADALNNLGVIRHAQGNDKAAEDLFLRALMAKNDHLDTLVNLADLYQNAKRWEDAAIQLEKCIAINSQEPNLYNQLGMVYFEMGDSLKARKVLAKSLKLNPDQEIVRQSLSALEKKDASSKDSKKEIGKGAAFFNEAHSQQNRRAKIAVLCLPGLQSFLGDIVGYLKTKYDVRTCYSNNNQEIESAVQWADLVWLEWANELTVALTNHSTLLDGKHIICRLHSYEAFSGFARKIKWEKIDDLVFVAKHIKDIVVQQVPEVIERVKNIRIVPNGVNLDKFAFKDPSKGTNLAYLGQINYKKGPMLLLHAFRELVQVDEKYRLFIGGNFQDDRYKLYFDQMIREMDLENNIQMDGWVEDVGTWLDDKQYIVCTSVLEGHPVGLMEAMTCGLKPVIHNFVGAREIYPEKYLWNSIPEFVSRVTGPDYDSREYRLFIVKHYSLQKQLKTIASILQEVPPSVKEDIDCNSNSHEQSPKEFYDNFLDYLKRDRERPNPRHEYIKKRLNQIIQPGKEVLDLGCGIGITTEHIARIGAKKVVGVDLSPKLVAFARKTVPHAEFRVGDITKLKVHRSFDLITLVDVMEHIPEERYEALFANLELHSHEETMVYLSVPDPQWIEFVQTHRPEKLQIIDNSIHHFAMLELARKHGFILYFFNTYGIDVGCQYNEYILKREKSASVHINYARVLGVQAQKVS